MLQGYRETKERAMAMIFDGIEWRDLRRHGVDA